MVVYSLFPVEILTVISEKILKINSIKTSKKFRSASSNQVSIFDKNKKVVRNRDKKNKKFEAEKKWLENCEPLSILEY